MVDIYTDGSHKNGFGGWGVVIPEGEHKGVLYGFANNTTSNRMEIQAVIEALIATDEEPLVIYTDSRYVSDGVTNWLANWKRWGWQKVNGKLKNKDLWMVVDKLIEGRNVEVNWIKAHNGNEFNELADHLANTARQQHLNSED